MSLKSSITINIKLVDALMTYQFDDEDPETVKKITRELKGNFFYATTILVGHMTKKMLSPYFKLKSKDGQKYAIKKTLQMIEEDLNALIDQ